MIDIVKLANGNVAIYDSTSGDFINSLSPDIVEIECNVNGSVKVVQDNGSVEYIDPAQVANTEVVPAAAIPFTGTCADLAQLLSNDFFFVVSGGGVVPTKTSDLINDGDDGNPFISLNDLPSNLILYPTTAASDIPTYFKLVDSITDPSFDAVAVNVSTGAITTTNQFISALATPANVIVGNPGVLNISTIGNIRRTAGTGNAEFYFEVWKRDLAGTETLITTSGNTPPVFNGIYAEFSATALWNDGIFLATDRIVLKFYGNRIVGGSDPTYDFQFGGSIPVRSLVPLPLTVVPVLKLDDLQDVTIATALNNDALIYESSTQLWKNKRLPTEIQLAASDETTALTAGTGKVTFRMPYAMTVTAVRASLTTAQASGSIFTVDINESGTTILSTKLTIDNTEKTSTTAATPAVISDTALADDAEITIDIDQIGNGTATGLKITLIGTR
jgi:hypothetical protein